MKKCDVCGKREGIIYKSKKLGKSLCVRHYKQLYRTGISTIRNQNDKNQITKLPHYAKMFLYNLYDGVTEKTLIDLQDIYKIQKYKWRLQSSGYVMGRIKGETVLLHRYLMDINNPKIQVDHRNHNKLDNRKQNLRLATPQENNFNRTFKSKSISGIKGVVWSKERKKWTANIKINSKNIFLGYFRKIEKAIKIRIEKELELFGSFANKEEIVDLIKKYNIQTIRFDK